METIDDIINEMRDEVRTSRENNPDPRTRIFLSTSNMAIEEFADRIEAAYKREIGERKGILKANDAFAADNTRLRGELAEKDAEIEKLKFDIMHLKSVQRTSGEVIIEQTNKVEAKGEEVAKLNRKVYEYEKLLASSPIGLIYQLGICNQDGDVMDGIGILFTNEAERAKMPRVGFGDKFYIVPYKGSEVK